MRRLCMVVHERYPDDARVRREAEALRDDGWEVDVVCLREHGERAYDESGGVRIFRLPVRRHRGSRLVVYLLEYLQFFLLASLRLAGLHALRRYDAVQVHNMPDFLVFTALVPRLLGARVVLDMHDLVPELYSVRFGGDQNHPAARLTRWAERRSIAFADHVITAGEPFRRRLVARGVPPEKVTVIMNSADPRLFKATPRQVSQESRNGFSLIYHGGLFERYGLDVAVRAVARLRHAIPSLRLDIYGPGEAAPMLERLIDELDLRDRVRLGGNLPIDAIPQLIDQADLGVVPYRRNPFTDLLYPSKAFEYIVMGVPVIMSRTGAVVELFGGVPDMFFQPEDVDDLAAHILRLYHHPERRQQLLEQARRSYAPFAWERQRKAYVLLMRRITGGALSPAKP